MDVPDGKELPQMGVVGTLADAFLAYASLASDMARVVGLLTALMDHTPPASEQDPDAVGDALWSAAVVGYARCFSRGRRRAFAAKVVIPDDLRVRHRWLIAHRNEHLAHLDPATDTEQARAVMFLQPADEERGVVAVGALSVRVMGKQGPVLAAYREVAVHMEQVFRDLATAANARIIALAQTEPVDRLYDAAARGAALRINEAFPPPDAAPGSNGG